MELWIIALLSGICLVSGLFGSFLWSFLFSWRLENKITAFNNKTASGFGVQARAQISAEQQERLVAAVAEFSSLKEQGYTLPQIAGTMLPKYADILPVVMKELGIKFSLKDIMRSL